MTPQSRFIVFAVTAAALGIGGAVSAQALNANAGGDRTADGDAGGGAWNAGPTHKLTEALALDLPGFDTDRHALGGNYDGRLVTAATYSF